MRRSMLVAALVATPMAAMAQGPTQSRDGLGNAGHLGQPTNSMPAGAENATTGPQARPAYPSGSTTPNPGAAFVDTRPVPADGEVLQHSPGALSTTTFSGGTAVTRPGGSPAVDEPAGKPVVPK